MKLVKIKFFDTKLRFQEPIKMGSWHFQIIQDFSEFMD